MKEEKFDLEGFKKYIATYESSDNSNETILNDIIYGIGVSLDSNKYLFFNGFMAFKQYLFNFLKTRL